MRKKGLWTRFYIFRIIFVICGVLGIINPVEVVSTVNAQTSPSDLEWTAPINISHTGGTENPLVVSDSENLLYVVWQDTYSGFMYSRRQGSTWSSPANIDLPSGTSIPLLIPDKDRFIHAFWTDNENNLNYSHTTNLSPAAVWTDTQILASSVITYDVSIDTNANLHLAFIQNFDSENMQAGIYYLTSSNNGAIWSAPVFLYGSPYLRGLSYNQANIQIMNMPDSSRLFVVWDNRPRKQIFMSITTNGGRNWNDPVQIDGPPIYSGYSGNDTPYNIRVGAEGNKVMLVWQTGEPGSSCLQYYKWSNNKGMTWSERQRMLYEITGCAQNNQFITGNTNFILLETAMQNQIYLSVWDGNKWSPLQAQSSISNFLDPETQNTVNFGCQQIIMDGKEQLVAVGCDNTSGKDIWVTGRSLGTASDWFPVASKWSMPITINNENCEPHNPISLTNSNGNLNAFWVQKVSTLPGTISSNQVYNIYTSFWDGKDWTTPTGILTDPISSIYQLHTENDLQGHLIMFWSSNDSGDIYFSWVNTNRSTIPSEWSKPQKLPIPQNVPGSIDIVIGKSEDISIAYSIPVNEERGIYFTQSLDGMQTWSEPVRIFDAAIANWDMVDQPILTQSTQYQVIWTQYSLPTGSGSKGLYYSRSEDNGKTWTEPEVIVDKPISWSRIINLNDRLVHRLWLENASGHAVITDQNSQDGGLNWNRALEISSLGNVSGPINVSSTNSSELLLEQIIEQGSGNFVLQTWKWAADQWTGEDNFNLNLESGYKVDMIVSAVTSKDNYAIVYSAYKMDEIQGLRKCNIYFINRSLNSSQIQASSTTVSPTQADNLPISEYTSTPSGTLTLTPTIASHTQAIQTVSPFSTEDINKARVSSTSNTEGLLLGVIMAVLTVSISLGIFLLILRNRRQW
jgi:hypothetical protein